LEFSLSSQSIQSFINAIQIERNEEVVKVLGQTYLEVGSIDLAISTYQDGLS
jgi:hypothetical protein